MQEHSSGKLEGRHEDSFVNALDDKHCHGMLFALLLFRSLAGDSNARCVCGLERRTFIPVGG